MPTPAPETLSPERTAAAYARHRQAHEARDWDAIAELFAVDGRYCDGFFGWIEGREAIAAFLHRSMAGLEGWSFPISWELVGAGRVVVHWHNQLPGRRPDGSAYAVPGVSMIRYGSDGLIVEQRDLYDRLATVQAIASARTGALGRALAWSWRQVSTRALELSHKLVTLSE